MELIKFLLIHVAVPLVGLLVFMWLREDMREDQIKSPPVAPMFIIFATYGGWLVLILTSLFWYWSGMALLGSIYLLFIAPIIMIGMALMLYPQRRLSRYHLAAFWASAGYICLPLAVVVLRTALSSIK